jgi:hypothetical protein
MLGQNLEEKVIKGDLRARMGLPESSKHECYLAARVAS